VAGDLLARRPEALAELGLERTLALADHEVVAVRAASHILLRAAVDRLRNDPSPLFELVESRWDDTRQLAFELLRSEIPLEKLGLDGLFGLIDSNRTDVQEAGCELVQKHFDRLPVGELIDRLVQHPHPALRRFTLKLIVEHLPKGAGPLLRVIDFCRTALFELWPERKVKYGVLAFLGARGLVDAEQASVAARLLGELVRVQARCDFERALEALVRIQLAYPEIKTAVTLRPGGVA
jgi:hypothetical protein